DVGDFSAILPAAVLVFGILGVLLTDLLGRGRRPVFPILVALAALASAAVTSWLGPRTETGTFLGVLRVDDFGVAFTVFCCVTGLVTILATTRGEAFRRPGGEFLVLILVAVLGMSILSVAVDLVTLYLAFETVSIPAYVLVGMRRADRKANEASMKYVLFGAVSSAMMLYGLSLLVGLAGTTSLDGLAVAVEAGAASQPAFLVAAILVFAGFAFKISAVPFHFWAPDVYAGAPASVGGFLAVASKAAGFAALVRVVGATVQVVPDAADPLTTFAYTGNAFILAISIAAVLTMTVGNLGALRQREIKRLLAWSSIAHAGYILLALAVWSSLGATALVVYLIAYLFMNLGAFLIAGIVIRERGTGDLKAFRGLGTQSPYLAVGLAIVLFSLTGLPPFLGFVGKVSVFYAVFSKGYLWLGVIGLLNGVISLYYYAKVLVSMYLDQPEAGEVPAQAFRFRFADRLLCAVLVLPILVFGIFWSGVWDVAQSVVPSLFGGG
ncbi:MAG: NADH-quinone oxidoreductase subunit N, partial [Planctomycetota bacterium]